MTRMTKISRLAVPLTIVALAAILGACGGSAPKKPPTGTAEPDKFLFDRGSDNLQRKRWIVSREYFRQLVDSYPQSPYRADAKLGIGDTYLGEKSAESYVLGINEFREFLNFYPTHPRAHYAQFKLGMAHFYQMKSPMRDQTETRDAIRELQNYVTKYADKPLIGEAQEKLREAKDRLDDWHVGVAEHYYRIKWYPGAIGRIMPLLKDDPEYSHRDKAYYLLAESLERVKRPAEALPYYEKLVAEFEQSEYLDKAKTRITELKATVPAAAGKDVPKGAMP
jgi:outer membrane protein assembly factor BamD